MPVTTKQGVNFEVSAHRLPLYLKAFEFLDRNAQYRQLANEITLGAAKDQARVLAVFNWTARRIQPAPEGWPVVDDHILNIIIRGYGTSDQRADVFATLATYAGVPAFWQKVKAPGTRRRRHPHVRPRRWTMGRDGRRQWLRVPERARRAGDRGGSGGAPALPPAAGVDDDAIDALYGRSSIAFQMPPIPRPLRAELQMPWPRLWYETRHAVGLEHDDGSER